jgi:cytochrome P450
MVELVTSRPQVLSPVQTRVPAANLWDTLRVFTDVLLPTISKGVIIRRPLMVALAEWLDLDRRAVRRMQHVRQKYGSGPLLIRLPGRTLALILHPQHVHRVLEASPEPFATATVEKRAALAHFEPKGALISHGAERADRRRYNEQVLESDRPVHHLAEHFLRVVREEAEGLIRMTDRRGQLTWNEFSDAWFRVVRRVVFGDVAREDPELSELMATLRARGNWAFLAPRRRDLQQRFFSHLDAQLAKAAPGSLASVMARTPATGDAAPSHQVPQWLFAFDPAGMTTFRSLALLAAHPEHADRVRDEIRADQTNGQHLPLLRATVLESLRLWPTTPLVLRDTTRETQWETGTMPPGTGIVIYAPFFHRDDQRLPFADRLAPELWLHERTTADWPLIPFSGGPGVCPGRHLVQMLTSAMLASLIRDRSVRLEPPTRLSPDRPLPGTLNNYSLRFTLGN